MAGLTLCLPGAGERLASHVPGTREHQYERDAERYSGRRDDRINQYDDRQDDRYGQQPGSYSSGDNYNRNNYSSGEAHSLWPSTMPCDWSMYLEVANISVCKYC